MSLTSSFPTGFTWGSATAAYQIEGAWNVSGKSESIWDRWTHEGILPRDTGDVACDHYNRYEEDVQLMADMGMRAYRFSLAWTRIMPNGTVINPEGVDFYNRLIDTLLRHDIQPWITLYHWDLPQWMHDEFGSWMGSEVVDYYTAYARASFEAFGDRVKHWITFNEPHNFCWQGYQTSTQAPSMITLNGKFQCAHNVLLSHADTYHLYHDEFAHQGGQVGMTNDAYWFEPLDASDPTHVEAAERSLLFELGWFTDPVYTGDYPQVMRDALGVRLPRFSAAEKEKLKGSMDFFGLNHYTTRYASPASEPCTGACVNTHLRDMEGNFIGPLGCNFWLFSVPWGFEKLIKYIDNRYSPQGGIFITENGFCDRDLKDMPLEEVLQDTGRIDYTQSYIEAMAKAMDDGADVRGYFAWSTLDNFEWAMGYNDRFGLHYVDFEGRYGPPRERYAKDSVSWWRDFLQEV